MSDLMELLRSLRVGPEYDNNLPGGGGPPRVPGPRKGVTMGEIRQAQAERQKRAEMEGGPAIDPSFLNPLTGPLRALGSAARMPLDVGADLVRKGVHGALGLEEAEPMRYTGKTSADLVGALEDTAAPIRAGYGVVRKGVDNAMDAARQALIAEGATPKAEPAPVSPARAAPVPAALAPRPERAVPRPMPPRGALQPYGSVVGHGDANGTEGFRAPVGALDFGNQASIQGGAPAAPQGALGGTAVPAVAPSEALENAYQKKVAQIENGTGHELSQEQKKQLRLDFYLGLLAGNKPGSTLLQGIGESGLAVSGKANAIMEKNRRASSERRREALDTAFREIGFMDRDQDNQRGDQRVAVENKRHTERMDLLRRQLEQGKWTVKDTDSGLVMIDAATGKNRLITGADGKPIKITGKSDEPADVRLIKYLESLPPDRRNQALSWLSTGKGTDDGKLIFDAAIKRLEGNIPVTVEQAVRDAREAMRQARGGEADPKDKKPDATANKGRTISGPDGRFKSDGKIWVKIE